ncbi:PEP-CTERM sorting domain-containing protein [Pontiella sp.]|uniref:PEP-CTERM sorting domain-containing protein n=1 Tax=Pontiella sp. TaxID=2837462 RepID=UPI003565FC3F
MSNFGKSVSVFLLAGSTAMASVVFKADFESGTSANTGTITYNAGYNVQLAVTGGPDATLGSNVLFADPFTGTQPATDITLTPTSAASLTSGQTAKVSLDFAIRRTNGSNKSHYVTGYDSGNNIIFQFVLGELDEFGHGASDRQRPGYATSSGANDFAGLIASGVNPGSYWFGNDSEASGFNPVKEAHFDITVGSDGWSVYNLKQDGTTFGQTTTLPTWDGGTYSELAYVKVTGETAAAGGFFDNLTIEAIPEPATLGMVAVFGGAVLFVRRRFMM